MSGTSRMRVNGTARSAAEGTKSWRIAERHFAPVIVDCHYRFTEHRAPDDSINLLRAKHRRG
jgi:hypothetical protein